MGWAGLTKICLFYRQIQTPKKKKIPKKYYNYLRFSSIVALLLFFNKLLDVPVSDVTKF